MAGELTADLALLALFRFAYVELLAAVVILLAPLAYRAVTARTQGRDFHFLLFWGLALNRLWFLARSVRFNDPPEAGAGFVSLVACYSFAILLMALVLAAYRWERTNGS